MIYKIDFIIDLDKTLKKVPKRDAEKIKEKIKSLSKNPRPIGAIKLSGRELYRVKAGLYRIVYSIFDSKLLIIVVEVDGRKDIYKNV